MIRARSRTGKHPSHGGAGRYSDAEEPRVISDPVDHSQTFHRVAGAILRERRLQLFEAIRVLWRTGDQLSHLRRAVQSGQWRNELGRCAALIDLHPASLYDALRASDAFPPSTREAMLQRFERASAPLTASHVIELARVTPSRRLKGIEILLSKALSVRELRSYLHTTLRDRHTFGESNPVSPGRL